MQHSFNTKPTHELHLTVAPMISALIAWPVNTSE
jgi:hypothetical protein